MSSKTPPPYPKVPTSPNKLPPSSASPVKFNEDSCHTFCSEMVEIAIDMMVKYTFSSSLTQPKRTAIVDQLLANGTSRSWLLGNVLITVTVSKRTPSKMPCAYCLAGKPSSDETSSRVGAESTAQSSTGTKSKIAHDKAGEHISRKNESSTKVKGEA